MANTPSLPTHVSHKVFVLVGSIDNLSRDSEWRSSILYYIDSIRKGLGDLPPWRIHIELVPYCLVSSVSVVPSYTVGGHDDSDARVLTDGTLARTGNSLDMAAFNGYMYIIKMIDGFQKQDPSGGFSFHLWHIAAGRHDYAEYPHFGSSPDSWDKWTLVHDEITTRDINLSMILTNPNCCLKLQQLFSALSRTRIQPWFKYCPRHEILLSGFVSPRGAVMFAVSARHPTLSGFVPSTIAGVIALDSPPNPPAHGTQHMTDNQRSGMSPIQHTRSDVTQVPATDPVPSPYEGSQASSPAAVQTLPHRPRARGLAPWSVSPHGSGVPQDDMGASHAGGGPANASAGPMAQGAWTGTLDWNGVYIHARAQATEAARNPKLSAWPKNLHVERVVAPEISILDFQRLIRESKAPVVRIDGMDDHFDQLVGDLGHGRGYAIVKWEDGGLNLERLLLAPLGKFLLCVAFPDAGIPSRPEHNPPPPVRRTPKKKRSPPVEMPTSPEDPYDEAAQSTSTMTSPPPPQLEQSSEAYGPQGFTQGDPNPSGYRDQTGVFTQHQATPMSLKETYFEAAHGTITPLPPQLEQSPVAYFPQDSTQGDPNSSSYPDQTGVFTQHQATSPPQAQQVQRSVPVTTPTSLEETYVEAAQRMVTPQFPVVYGPQGAGQGGPNSSTSVWDQTDVFVQHQAMSSPQVEQVQQACTQAQWGPRSISPDGIGDQRTDAGIADYVAGSFCIDFGPDATGWRADSSFGGTSIASSEEMEGSDMDEFIYWDGTGA